MALLNQHDWLVACTIHRVRPKFCIHKSFSHVLASCSGSYGLVQRDLKLISMTFRYHFFIFLCFLLLLARSPRPRITDGAEFLAAKSRSRIIAQVPENILHTPQNIVSFCGFLNRDPITYVFFVCISVCVCAYLYPIFVCVYESVAPHGSSLTVSPCLFSLREKLWFFVLNYKVTLPRIVSKNYTKENLQVVRS